MPIYEYQCQKCHHHFDKLQKLSDDPLKICPNCQEPSLQKLVSAAGFQLKGTGWYVTDFRDKAAKPAKLTDSAPDTSAAATEKKSDNAATSVDGE